MGARLRRTGIGAFLLILIRGNGIVNPRLKPKAFPHPRIYVRLVDLEPRTVKQVIAIIKPYLVEKVLDALKHAPLEACGVCEVKGYGRQKSYLDEYRGSEYSLAFLPKVEITLWVDDLRVEEVVRVIVEVARTGRMGDGKIFVMPAMPGGEWDGDG